MEPDAKPRSLPFSIDNILARKDTSSENTRKYSPYADDNVMTSGTCFGTEALDARLLQTSSSGESADEDDFEADDSCVNTSSESRSDCSQNITSADTDRQNLVLKCKTKKKTRTVFSRQQVFYLEAAFDAKRYLSSAERSEIATSLNLSETQVKVWFQNRRNKWKAQLNGDDKGVSSQDHGPIFLPPFLCSSVAAAAAHAQSRQHGGVATMPFFRQPVFY